MATIADNGFPTLRNILKRMRPDGSVETQMANTLSKKLALLDDMPFVEGNLPTGHRVTAVTSLPPVTWRKLNQGVQSSKGETNQYDETVGMLEAYPQVDCALAELNGNAAAYRQSEESLHVEAMTEEAERAFFYESSTSHPERIHGLAARYAATTGYQASNYVLKSGNLSSAACESIWVVTWDPERIFGIYPKGSVAGLQHEDLGKRLVTDANNNRFLAYVSHKVWKPGLCVKDFRYATRLQWDPSDANQTDTAKLLYTAIENALGTVREVNNNTRIYMSRTSRRKLGAQLLNNDNRALQAVNENGAIMEAFMGVRIRLSDALVGETAIA